MRGRIRNFRVCKIEEFQISLWRKNLGTCSLSKVKRYFSQFFPKTIFSFTRDKVAVCLAPGEIRKLWIIEFRLWHSTITWLFLRRFLIRDLLAFSIVVGQKCVNLRISPPAIGQKLFWDVVKFRAKFSQLTQKEQISRHRSVVELDLGLGDGVQLGMAKNSGSNKLIKRISQEEKQTWKFEFGGEGRHVLL